MVETLLIYIIVFLCIFLAVMGFSYWLNNLIERKRISERINQDVIKKMPVFKNYFFSLSRLLGKFSKPKDEKELPEMEQKLLKAGYRRQHSAHIVYGVKALCAVLVPLILFALKLALGLHLKLILIMSVLVSTVLLGFYLPDMFLSWRISDRKQKILNRFPDALDLLIVCVEAGMSLDSAITRVGEELKLSHPVLSNELKYLNLELRAGKSRRGALRNFGLRSDLDDVMSFMTLLIQTDRFGTSIAQALRVYSETMRTQRYQRAEEMAAKLPVKLVLPLILSIFPSLFVVILGPAIIQIIRIWGSR